MGRMVSALSCWKELLGLNEIEVLDLDEGQPLKDEGQWMAGWVGVDSPWVESVVNTSTLSIAVYLPGVSPGPNQLIFPHHQKSL